MDTAIWVGLIIALGGTIAALLKRSTLSSSKLMHAADIGDLEKFRKLLRKRKVKINNYGIDGNSPLHIAAGKWAKEGLIPDILAKGALVNIRNVYGKTPLHIAVEFGNLDVITILLENGAEINVKDKYDKTPLTVALKKKRKRVIALLKEYGAR